MAAGGHLRAYTAEHFEQDVTRGLIVRARPRQCPRHRPEHDCQPDAVPAYYRGSWRRRAAPKLPPAAPSQHAEPSRAEPGDMRASGSRAWRSVEISRGRPVAPLPPVVVRVRVAVTPAPARPNTVHRGEICFECKTWLQWCDRRAFIEEVGDELGYAVTPRLADAGDVFRATEARAVKDLAELLPLTGPLPFSLEEPLDWFKISNLAAAVRAMPGVDDLDVELAEVLSRFLT